MSAIDPVENSATSSTPPARGFGELIGESPRDSRLKRWLWRFVFVAVIALGLYVLRAPILRGVATAWVINESPTNADAIVVLGGNPSTRPFVAAKLFNEGRAPRVLVMNTERNAIDDLGVTTPDSDLNRRVLRALKVPDAAVVSVGREVSSTYEEALAVRDWARSNRVRRLLIPTDLFHTRRVGWTFGKVMREADVAALVTAIPNRKYGLTNWWQHEDGLIGFQNEVLKFALYLGKY